MLVGIAIPNPPSSGQVDSRRCALLFTPAAIYERNFFEEYSCRAYKTKVRRAEEESFLTPSERSVLRLAMKWWLAERSAKDGAESRNSHGRLFTAISRPLWRGLAHLGSNI